MSRQNRHLRLGLALLIGLDILGLYQGGLQWRGRQQHQAALAALEKRDFRQARVHLENWLALGPNDLTANLLAAQVARRQGAFDEARHHLRSYREKKGPAAPLEREEQLLRLQQGDLHLVNGLLSFSNQYPQSAETPLVLEAVIETVLNELLPLYTPQLPPTKVVASPVIPKLHKAIEQWLEQQTGQADQVQGLVWRGRLHRLSRDYSRAVADFKQALDLDPDHFQARLELAMEINVNDPQTAVDHLAILHAREPENVQVCFMLAVAFRSLGKLPESQILFDEILAATPDHVQTLIERGHVGMDLRQPLEAEGFFRRALALAPNEPGSRLALARCLQVQGKTAEARVHLSEFQILQAEQEKTKQAEK